MVEDQDTAFLRAKANYDEASGEGWQAVRNVECPSCGQPMELVKSYRPPDAYRVVGECTADPDHRVERYGYYSQETT
jgi:hypothetical protein